MSLGLGVEVWERLRQCECGLPVPHLPQEVGTPEQLAPASSPAALEANTESFFCNFTEPQCGQGVPSQALERTSTSLSRRQASQWNS